MKLTNNLSREDKKMINSICWRSLNAHCSRVGGQARQMAIGFLWQIMPALNRYYKDQPEKRKMPCIVMYSSVMYQMPFIRFWQDWWHPWKKTTVRLTILIRVLLLL